MFKETLQTEVSTTNKNINITLEYVQSLILKQKPTYTIRKEITDTSVHKYPISLNTWNMKIYVSIILKNNINSKCT